MELATAPARKTRRITCGRQTTLTLVVEAKDENDARAFLAQDPYARVNLWDSIHISAFAAVAGSWVGGATWLK